MNNSLEVLLDSNVTDLIKNRHSVRDYTNQKISAQILSKINDFAASIKNPFPNVQIRYEILDINNFKNGKITLGTYGVIKGATKFLVPIVTRGNYNYEGLGYSLEATILYALSLGIHGCILGGSFSRSSFEKAACISEKEQILALSPLGYESSRKSLIGKVFSNSGKREDGKKLFFNENTSSPLTKSSMGAFAIPFEFTRLAPSTLNKQPWKIIKENNMYHFFKSRSVFLSNIDKTIDSHRIDMGIAMLHFELGCMVSDLDGYFEVQKSKVFYNIPDKYEYLITYNCDK